MTALLIVLVIGIVVIATATVAGRRIGIASPLVLVAVGVVASLVPVVGSVEIRPEWVLEGVLPPLLYSAAVSMPAMNFRREFGAISVLSVLLVVGSALLIGLFVTLVVPGLPYGWGVALGAIVSPTDAVATSIIARTTVSKRVVAILDGESLLNDATALVLLRTATGAAAIAFSFWGTLGTFAYSVAVAVVIGWLVAWLNLEVRKRIPDPTVNTVVSFAVPFVASVPAGLLGASGLVAAVVAGLITGVLAPRYLSPQDRLSDSQNWGTVELVLEGAVFLAMGVEVLPTLRSVGGGGSGVGAALLIAVGALVAALVVRAVFVAPLLVLLRAMSRHGETLEERLQTMQERSDTEEGRRENFAEMNEHRGLRRPPSERQLQRFAVRVTRVLADIEYFRRDPLGWREGTAVVWAGLRGAVTVAAAQTLPPDTPQRPLLVLVAFAVAALSLLVQGVTIGPLLRLLRPRADPEAAAARAAADRERILALMRTAAEGVARPPLPDDADAQQQVAAELAFRRASLEAQRSTLLDARDDGTFDADLLTTMLANLDASQIAIELRGDSV